MNKPSIFHPSRNVVDAKKDIGLHITARDIRRGNNKEPGGCAAALACLRETHAVQAMVYLSKTFVQFKRNGPWHRLMTPRNLASEIIAFDRGGEFMPGDYTLRAPKAPSEKLGYKKAPETNRQRPLRKNRRRARIIAHVRSHARYGAVYAA